MSIEQHREDETRWRDWMRRAQQGDSACYERLLGELGSVIESYLRARFGALDALEDCVQECLIALHKARHTYNPRRAFRPWMFTVVRHRTIDLLRARSSRIQASSSQATSNQAAEALADDPEHLLRLIDGVRVLESLKPDHREAVTLTKYAGMTTAEAASWLGVSESALKARLNRGLLAIRRQLDAEGLPV